MRFLLGHYRHAELYLYSQVDVKDFYAKCGFLEHGERFFEAGIQHIEMHLQKNEDISI